MLQPEEVVEVFVGDTLEEAMAYAVAALGPDLSVRRARKVRKGVQGLVGRDKYEVVAIPPPAPPSSDAVGSAFDALLSQAEAAEAPRVVRRTTRPHPSPEVADHEVRQVRPAVFAPLVREPAPEVVAAGALEAPPAPPVAPAPRVVPAPKAAAAAAAAAAAKKPAARKAAKAPRTEPAAAAPKRAPTGRRAAVAPTGWSREALVDLGLPSVVLDALPADDPADDLAWVVALAVALTAVLPAPAALSTDNPLVVNGYGMAGVLGLLDAAARGLTPGTITVGDRTAAATATELALAVRTAVVG